MVSDFCVTLYANLFSKNNEIWVNEEEDSDAPNFLEMTTFL